ncbi:hypothetical protein TNCV_895251 [Trichonephila clavipes]|nr:hypothetical protein TNCV_895251 [Trichonephila clavipes]
MLSSIKGQVHGASLQATSRLLQAARKLAQCTHRTRLKAAFKKALEKLTLPATLHATRRLLSDLDCKLAKCT